jgi:hypothetical protein
MTEKQKQWTAWAILTAVTVAISLFFGVKYPVPPIPEDLPDQVVPLGVTHFTGLAIGDGTANLATGDDDLYVEGDLEVDDEIEADGTIDADAGVSVAGGKLDVDDAVDIDGSSDETQLAVTGYTTQTSDLVQFDGGLVDIGGATYAVADGDDDLGIAGVLEVDGEFEADGAIDADSTLKVAGAVTFQGAFYPSFTNLAVSNNTLITPTYTVYALDSTAAASCTLQATGTEGQLLILIGDDANNVTVNDTNLRSNDGSAQVLNAYDVLMLVYQDNEWLEISESNDS